MRLLSVCQLAAGGISDYVHDQSNAMVELGIEITLLCSPGFSGSTEAKYKKLPILVEELPASPHPLRFIRRVKLGAKMLRNMRLIADHIAKEDYKYVLTTFSEYLAPIWAGRFRKLASEGVRFGTVVHDPVRDYQVGPLWWHQKSVSDAYHFVEHSFIHEEGDFPIPEEVKQHVVPYGCHACPDPERTRTEVRSELQIPEGATLLVAFGFIRDNKNLDLVIQALAHHSEFYLLVVGPNMEGGNRPISYYKNLAETTGVSDRCRWIGRFVRGSEMGDLFSASDVSILTYSSTFHSASSALSSSTFYRLPCLASAGQGNLERVVKDYQLGVWIEPDSKEAVIDGLGKLKSHPPEPDWDRYFIENSWDENARRILDVFRSNTVDSMNE